MNMNELLGFLPFLTLFVGFFFIHGFRLQKVKRQAGFNEVETVAVTDTLVATVAIWGTYIAILSEGLGYFRAISFWSLLISWGMPLLLLLALCFQKGFLITGWRSIHECWIKASFSKLEKIFLAVMSFWVLILFLIAWISPPNTNDSLGYHLARVAHWAQNGSLAHYPTAYEPQLFNSIWAELVILHSYVLAASDRLSNLVQWLSMVGCVFWGMEIAGKLGANRTGKFLAGSLILTIPMGILQSTSTQNDYVVAFWLMTLLYLIVRTKGSGVNWLDAPGIGAVIGLGMMTKGTYYPYAIPFLLWLFFPLLWRIGLKKTLLFSTLTAVVALPFNFPFWMRNLTTYQSFIGPDWWVKEKSLGNFSPLAIFINLFRNISVHFGTPFVAINSRISERVVRFCEMLGQAECITLNDSSQYY